jgi:hypothetical protein
MKNDFTNGSILPFKRVGGEPDPQSITTSGKSGIISFLMIASV